MARRLSGRRNCPTLDRERLYSLVDPQLRELLLASPNLFSPVPVFLSKRDASAMSEVVSAIERVASHPGYRQEVLGWAPEIARFEPKAKGVCFGYDFHLSDSGPKLIEINTNAGGAMLNILLARAQRGCSDETRQLLQSAARIDAIEFDLFEMFVSEWKLSRGEAELRRIAIVDEDCRGQHLYPEFLLFQKLFLAHGIDALIVDADQLEYCDNRLSHHGLPIDLVYNRLTDFSLEGNPALRQAYLDGAAVVTPHPAAHALYADKRNLTLLCDAERLRSWGVDESAIETLQLGIARTETVSARHAEALWARRRQLFFKPATGYGGKAAYQGAKLTKRVWGEILAGEYVAQEYVAPPLVQVGAEPDEFALKFDLRNFAYDGRIQLLAARLYQGQTTNFRTVGGGFSTVLVD